MKKKGMGKRAFAACLAVMTVAQSNAFAATGNAGVAFLQQGTWDGSTQHLAGIMQIRQQVLCVLDGPPSMENSTILKNLLMEQKAECTQAG